jgi:hypothetical protein
MIVIIGSVPSSLPTKITTYFYVLLCIPIYYTHIYSTKLREVLFAHLLLLYFELSLKIMTTSIFFIQYKLTTTITFYNIFDQSLSLFFIVVVRILPCSAAATRFDRKQNNIQSFISRRKRLDERINM